jgi:hypothetical protein
LGGGRFGRGVGNLKRKKARDNFFAWIEIYVLELAQRLKLEAPTRKLFCEHQIMRRMQIRFLWREASGKENALCESFDLF